MSTVSLENLNAAVKTTIVVEQIRRLKAEIASEKCEDKRKELSSNKNSLIEELSEMKTFGAEVHYKAEIVLHDAVANSLDPNGLINVCNKMISLHHGDDFENPSYPGCEDNLTNQ